MVCIPKAHESSTELIFGSANHLGAAIEVNDKSSEDEVQANIEFMLLTMANLRLDADKQEMTFRE